jgi:hypothetical protein
VLSCAARRQKRATRAQLQPRLQPVDKSFHFVSGCVVTGDEAMQLRVGSDPSVQWNDPSWCNQWNETIYNYSIVDYWVRGKNKERLAAAAVGAHAAQTRPDAHNIKMFRTAMPPHWQWNGLIHKGQTSTQTDRQTGRQSRVEPSREESLAYRSQIFAARYAGA